MAAGSGHWSLQNRDMALKQEKDCRAKIQAECRLEYWLLLLQIPHNAWLTRGSRRNCYQMEVQVRPYVIGAAKLDIGVKNV